MIQFRANLILSLLAILVLWLLLSLGFWQLDRANEKQHLLNLQDERLTLPPVNLMSLDISNDKLRYLPVKVKGELDAQHQVLIDNQIRNGQVGYSVLTPLKLNSEIAILLNRGWITLGSNRSQLPDVKIDIANVSVRGHLDHFPSVGIKLDKADLLSAGWPAVTQVVDIKRIEERLGYQVMPYQLLLNKDEPNGYYREWVIMKMGPEKHHGYAFQWFALSVAWIILYFVLTIKRVKN